MMNVTKFKEVHTGYDNYLLKCLNNGDSLEDISIADAKKVSGDFVSSRLFFLHNTDFKKTVVSAFHIPDTQGKLHHFDIRLIRFIRKKKNDQWKKEAVKNLRDQEVQKLYSFIEQQNKLTGRKLSVQYYRIFSANSPVSLQDLDFALDLVLKNQHINFSQLQENDIPKILNLIQKILEGDNVILEKKLYQYLLSTRTNPKSLKNYERDLANFKDKLKNDGTTETDMQDFLENKVWFFGLNYVQSCRRSKPRFNSTLGAEYDFLLEGFNQVYDIVELKGPNEFLFETEKIGKRSGAMDNRFDYRFSTKFARALHQVMSYMDEFEQCFDQIKTQQPSIKNFIYPKGTIVISKRDLFPKDGKNSIKYLHLINRQFSNIDILTYDDLANRAQIIIDFMKSVQG